MMVRFERQGHRITPSRRVGACTISMVRGQPNSESPRGKKRGIERRESEKIGDTWHGLSKIPSGKGPKILNFL